MIVELYPNKNSTTLSPIHPLDYTMNLNQVTIPSLDVTEAIEFYQLIGLELIVKSLPNYARFQCPNGESTFSIHLLEEIPEDNGTWIYFEVENVDQTIEHFLREGIIIDKMPEDKPWLWREARLKDPDGNLLIIYHAGENRKDPPWRI